MTSGKQACLAKKNRTTEECQDIEALIDLSLIPPDKNPRVTPIAIGEVFTQLLGNYILAVMREDINGS